MKTAIEILKQKVIPNLIKKDIHDKYLYIENDILEVMEEYADQFRNKSEEMLCGSCNKFQVDDINFENCGLCMTGNYHNAKKKSDVCDNPTQYKLKKK